MKWQIRIQEPSGEARVIPFRGSQLVGRDDSASISLRDPTGAPEALVLWQRENPQTSGPDDGATFWIRTPEGAPNVRLGDLHVREAELPSRIPVRVGETEIRIEPVASNAAIPAYPMGTKPWLTRSE